MAEVIDGASAGPAGVAPTTADFRALERLDGATPSLTLLDLTRPGMDGFAVLKRLRRRPDRGLVPVMVLTARDVTPEERACLDRQADRVISEGSLSLPDLARALRGLMPAAGRS